MGTVLAIAVILLLIPVLLWAIKIASAIFRIALTVVVLGFIAVLILKLLGISIPAFG